MNGYDSVVIGSVEKVGSDSYDILLTIPGSASYFDGHFDAFQLLPAVGEIDIISNVSGRVLGRSLEIVKINRTKFSKPVRPDMPIRLKLDFSKPGLLSFTYLTAEGEEVCSKGIVSYISKEVCNA